jgi:hypothetical protein
MRTLKQILLEKLKINHKSHIINTEDFCYPVETKDGKEYLWYKWWKYLDGHGPTSKKDLLSAFNLSVTSYSTMFAKLSRRNIIVPVKGKLVAKDPNEWRPNIN